MGANLPAVDLRSGLQAVALALGADRSYAQAYFDALILQYLS
jgi:hypothetical protein